MALLGLVSKKKDENKDDDYLHVDTGDSLKMKQVLDEACVKAVLTKDYDELHFIDNLKISLMVVACLFAVTAQFYPLPFPASRPLLGVCCSGYFIFSGILQLVVKFVEKDAIVVTHPKAGARKGLRVRSAFPRYQSDYTIIVQLDEPDAPEMEEKHCVGKFFDADGYFWEQGFIDTVQKLVERFESKKTN
eukprot:CAMPEP_0184125662 /NCGR_PEP_ID=MMETSP0974-20121125/25150_1 /TAXON_ID=483370 /ORGANISM="non described non described, Strain CCMP2097" /LENGTH=189 /DNA_ID=CAMNT_0026429001 /DNA_START=61 /DNA_END=630 /DNA_ORIENTATION=-